MADIVIILGSGFSFHAGLPLSRDINKYFERDNAENILCFSSGEFKWFDLTDETHQHNGRNNTDYLAFGILLNELVSLFTNKNDGFNNYEEFYQFVLDETADKNFIEDLKKTSIKAFNVKFPEIKKDYHETYTRKIKELQISDIKSMINHLIGELLYVRKSCAEVDKLYEAIGNYFNKYAQTDFISLNHDLLLEHLLKEVLQKEYSDGFSNNQNILKSSDQEPKPLQIFQEDFSLDINIIKLHGSIDTYRYPFYEGSSLLHPTGEYLYFKPHDYYEKQRPERYNPETNEKVQTFHWEISPQFITGTNKEALIKNDTMYASMYNEAKTRLLKCKEILIIGYSFGDIHVNDIIKNAIEKSTILTSITNVNPSTKIPFDTKDISIIQLNDFNELTL